MVERFMVLGVFTIKETLLSLLTEVALFHNSGDTRNFYVTDYTGPAYQVECSHICSTIARSLPI